MGRARSEKGRLRRAPTRAASATIVALVIAIALGAGADAAVARAYRVGAV
jgi:hypothetical protein